MSEGERDISAQRILVHGMSVSGGQELMVRRRTYGHGRSDSGRPVRKLSKSIIMGGDGLFRGIEELEVFGALCAMLLANGGESVLVHMERPTTFAMWHHIRSGGSFSADLDIVRQVRAQALQIAPSIRLSTASGMEGWDIAQVERDIADDMAARSHGREGVLRWARETLAANQALDMRPECLCGKRLLSFPEAEDALIRARSGKWTGPVPPVALFKCPAAPGFHLTSRGKWKQYKKVQSHAKRAPRGRVGE